MLSNVCFIFFFSHKSHQLFPPVYLGGKTSETDTPSASFVVFLLTIATTPHWSVVYLKCPVTITQLICFFSVCLDVIKSHSFIEDGYEGIDGIFEYIISREKKGAKGQFFTPRYLVDFCVNILNPKANESILDPAAGSGAFLYHAYLHGKINGSDLWGFDFDNTATRVARLLMYIGEVKASSNRRYAASNVSMFVVFLLTIATTPHQRSLRLYLLSYGKTYILKIRYAHQTMPTIYWL